MFTAVADLVQENMAENLLRVSCPLQCTHRSNIWFADKWSLLDIIPDANQDVKRKALQANTPVTFELKTKWNLNQDCGLKFLLVHGQGYD